MLFQRTVAVVFGMLLFAVSVECADLPFQDDFSNGANSNINWKSSNDFITALFDGACKVTNSSSQYGGYVYHKFTNKPSVFTVSCKITRSDATINTGLATCFSTVDYKNFSIMLGAKEVYFYGPGDTSSIGVTSAYIDAKVNVLKISKKGSTINVFVNDHFVKSYDDSRTAGGDIAFLANANTSVSFDDFIMTEDFTSAPTISDFSDNFEDGDNRDWTSYGYKGSATEINGKLNLMTENNDSSYVYSTVDYPLSSFEGKAEFSHRAGSTNSVYGLVLEGDSSLQRATFAINANGKYGVSEKVKSFTLYSSQSIKGKAYVNPSTSEKTYYIDTLEIIKRTGAAEYIFVVNQDTVARLTGIDYPVLRAGVFCQDSLEVTVDNFSLKNLPGNTAIKERPRMISSGAKFQVSHNGTYMVDPLGRTILTGRIFNNNVSTGIYLTKNYLSNTKLLLIKK